MRWKPVPATTAGPNPAFSILASFHVKTTVQPFPRCTGGHSARLQLGGLPRGRGGSSGLEQGLCRSFRAVSAGLGEAEVQVTESQNHRMVGVGRDLCGSPRAGCTAPRPGGSGISPEKETPQPPWAARARAPSFSQGRSSSSLPLCAFSSW